MSVVKQTIYLFATLIALAYSFWFFSNNTPKFKLDSKTLLETNDMLITNVSLRQYSKAGALAHSLNTPLIRHIPKNNTHWLKQPHIIVTRPNQPVWEINAEEATALYGGQEITLHQAVKIHQNQGNHNEETTFTAEEITYFPKTKIASTKKNVNNRIKLDQGKTHLRAANAMTKVNFNNQLVEALAEGNQTEPAHFWTTTDGKKPSVHAYAHTLSYEPQKHFIVLTGNARVTQGKDSFSAQTIRYDTLHQHVISVPKKQGQTIIIIHPDKKHNTSLSK